MKTSRQQSAPFKLADKLRQLTSYYSASIDIRNSIALQIEDEHFTRVERGSIRYVLDSNLIRFFLNPVTESDKVNPFSDKRSSAYHKQAIITAEFIFSREMEGQWGLPAMISPSHMEELSTHIDKLVKRLAEQADAIEAQEDVLQEENQFLHEDAIRLAQASENIGPSVDAFNAEEPQGKFRKNQDWIREIREADTFERMRRQDLLVPLYLDENATSEVITPRESAVREWTRLLKAHHAVSSAARSKDQYRNPLKNQADAETAEQIVQINRVVAEDALTPTRYVLVTSDRNLFNAAVEWWETGGRDQLDFFPFRRLSQYIPCLNTERLPNNLRATDVKNKLYTAFDSLLGMGSRRKDQIPLYIPEPTISPPSHSLAQEIFIPLQWISDQWERVEPIHNTVVALWREMTERSNYLNPELLSRRDETYENFKEFLANSPNTREAAVAYLRQAVERVDVFNIELSIAHNIGSEIIKCSEANAARSIRALPVLRERFETLLEDQSLYDLLNKVMIEKDVHALLPVVKKLAGEERWRAAYFAGCVAFWVGQWDSAAVYARRAIAAADTSERRAELSYFRVLTARFAALDIPVSDEERVPEALRRISRALEQNKTAVEEMMAAAADSDAFARARARLEKALWELSILFVKGFQNEAQSPEVESQLTELKGEFRSLGQDLRGLGSPGIPKQALETMSLECLVGEAACLVFEERLSNRKIDPLHRNTLAEAIEERITMSSDMVPEFYKIAAPMLRNDPELATEIAKLIEENHHITWFDRTALIGFKELAETNRELNRLPV